MESFGLEMDLFDDCADISEDLAQAENVDNNRMNHTEMEGDGMFQNETIGEGDISRQVAEKLSKLKQGAAKTRVLRPQPKMDPTRLCGERGMPILPKIFAEVKFQGKGYEEDNLIKLLETYEHWAHRMFPKMPFEEMIERIERLGQKRQVQTTLSKMRQGMPVLEADFVSQVISDDEAQVDEVQARFSKPLDDLLPRDEVDEPHHVPYADEEENLNDIINELEAAAGGSSSNLTNHITASTPFPKRPSNTGSEPERGEPREKENQEPQAPELGVDILEKIRRNRELALQRLKARHDT